MHFSVRPMVEIPVELRIKAGQLQGVVVRLGLFANLLKGWPQWIRFAARLASHLVVHLEGVVDGANGYALGHHTLAALRLHLALLQLVPNGPRDAARKLTLSRKGGVGRVGAAQTLHILLAIKGANDAGRDALHLIAVIQLVLQHAVNDGTTEGARHIGGANFVRTLVTAALVPARTEDGDGSALQANDTIVVDDKNLHCNFRFF